MGSNTVRPIVRPIRHRRISLIKRVTVTFRTQLHRSCGQDRAKIYCSPSCRADLPTPPFRSRCRSPSEPREGGAVKRGPTTSWVARGLRALVLILIVLGLSFGGSPSEEPVASTPHDVPLLVRPSAIAVPSVPATYEKRDLGWITMAYPPSVRERVQP